MVTAVTEEQRVDAEQSDAGRTSNTGAWLPCTAALISPCTFPATNTVINCPGATAACGYRYPMPTIVFTGAPWPKATGESTAHKRVNVAKYLIILRPGGYGLSYSDGATQIPAPSNEYCPPTLTVRFDCTVPEQAAMPAGGTGTMKLIWYSPTNPGARPEYRGV